MIVQLAIHNYKSLRNARLENIQPFSVVVGANASGKSNFVDALDFLAHVFRGGLAHAVRTKGGYENICFRRARRARGAIRFEVVIEGPALSRVRHSRGEVAPGKVVRFHYNFEFKARTEAIAADYDVRLETFRAVLPGRTADPLVISREGKSYTLRYSGKVARELGLPSSRVLRSWLKDRVEYMGDGDLLIPQYGFLLGEALSNELEGCRVYQITPNWARQTGVPERSPMLGTYGENLPAAVEYLSRMEPTAFGELLAHLRHVVPSFERLKTDYLETKQLGLFFTESGVGRPWAAQDVSDGTIQAVALYLALLDPRNQVVVLEEPENSIHPWILRHFTDVCKETSRKRQVFLTTHSVVLLNEVPAEAVVVTIRRHGETQLFRAAERFPEMTRDTQLGLLGLGAYWDTGAIEGVPEPALIGD